MKFVYTLHVEDKLKWPEIVKLNINKKKIEEVIVKPIVVDKSEYPVIIGVGRLTAKLSLCVAYRKIGRSWRIITFYPVEKGRYERKILQAR